MNRSDKAQPLIIKMLHRIRFQHILMFKTELGRNILHKFTRWTLNFGSHHKYERKTAYVDHHVTTGWIVNDAIVALCT